MNAREKAIEALELTQHLWACEDEGMVSGQPTARDYRKARGLVDEALAALRTEAEQPDVAGLVELEGCATNPIIGNVRQRWQELGYDDPERVAERYRGDPWRLFYAGWIEGRAPLIIAAKSAAHVAAPTDVPKPAGKVLTDEVIERYADQFEGATRIAVLHVVRHVRDHHLAPAPSVSVEQVMAECERCYTDGLSGNRGWPVYREELRARLNKIINPTT